MKGRYTIELNVSHGPQRWYRLNIDGSFNEDSVHYKYFLYGNECSKEDWEKHQLIVALSGIKDD